MSIIDRKDTGRRFEGKGRIKWLGLLVAFFTSMCAVSHASAETRTLKLYFIHTKERAEITFKRNGRYDQNGIAQINRFLRDWRRNEPAKMDPKVLDLLWEVYRSVGARDYIHIVSAYRSPATNSMLRNRSSGVAKNSQHTQGRAIDFFIPGVPLARLRAAGFKAEAGGVGFYPKSGSPFVHMDTGSVRSWPRMSRSELVALFPDGKTLHLPSDGKPLPGYQQAMAAYKARERSGAPVQIASMSSSSSRSNAPAAAARSADRDDVNSNPGNSGSGGGLLAALFRGGQGNNNNDAPAAAPVPRAPVPAAPVARAVEQPVPVAEPEPETPASIIAALPARSVPLPLSAPRPIVDIGAPAAAPLVAGLPAAQPVPAEVAPELAVEAPVEVALNIPVPARRPNYAAPAPEPEQQVAAAEAPAVNLPVTAIVPEAPKRGGSDAILEMLATSAAEARADVVINSPPVPGLRPRLTAPEEGRQVAAADPQAGGDVFVLASLPEAGMSASDARQPEALPRGGRLVPGSASANTPSSPAGASPRVAMIERQPGSSAARALESGVRTTAKSSKPRAAEARQERKPVAVPMQQDLTRWAFMREVTVSTAGGTAEPSVAHDIVRSAPNAVYTTGFQQGDAGATANRFSGNAVTFIPVARFSTN